MYSNIYSHPEKYALRTIGEVEWSDACYSFDLTVVWQDVNSGAFYYADDSGCSCPSPFEDTSREDLIPIDRPQVLIDHVNQRLTDMRDSSYLEGEVDRAVAESAELIQKVRAAA